MTAWRFRSAGGKDAPPWNRHAALAPREEVEWLPKPAAWAATGSNPQFSVEGQAPWPGWNMLELDIESEVMHGLAELEVETARGRFTMALPLRPGSRSKRLVFIPWRVRAITLTLLEAHGQFRLPRLCWVWLTPRFARDRLARRLANVLPAYKGLSVSRVTRVLHQESLARGRSWRQLALEEYGRSFARACAGHHYPYWINEIEPRRSGAWLAGKALDALSVQPVISVLLPLDETLARVGRQGLQASLASLQAQSYRQWELCAVVSPSVPPDERAVIEQCLGRDARVQLLDGHKESLAELTHQAFVASHGEGVMTLSAGDQLAPYGLERVVRAWNDEPGIQLFYADQDEIDASGKRQHPNFKPHWNPDLLMATGYIGRLAVYRRTLLWRLEVYRDIGRACWSRLSAEERDHAVALRFLAWVQQRPDTSPVPVKHLSGVLYHRHVAHRADGSREGNTVSLVREFIDGVSPEGGVTVEAGLLAGGARVRWPIPEPEPLVSLLVPTRDGIAILKPCVDAILERTEYRRFELLILDNQSTCPETLAYMAEVEKRDPRVRVLRWNHPFNYSAINNFGAQHARGEIIGLINNDVEPMEGTWLTEMVSQACRPEIGCVGAKLYYPNGTIQHGGVILGLGGVAGHAHRFFPRHEDGYCGRLKLVQNLSAVTAACLLLRREVFEEVGGLNEPDLAVAYNDVDLCLKVREAGYRNLWTPHAELYHHESISRGEDNTPEKRARWLGEMAYMKRTWGKLLQHDPAYNPNLTMVYEDFSLR